MTKSHEKGPDISDVQDKTLGKESTHSESKAAADTHPAATLHPMSHPDTLRAPVAPVAPPPMQPVKPVPLNVPYERPLIPGEPEDNDTPKVADPREFVPPAPKDVKKPG